ncbi:hypothetical protein FGG08_007606 [Glutinoglossum americanum]|uniref:YCII-related domain-containing protein n=1 Tax=Glutinoglossum americanum TaxID=1670608 RepID=A0A9P8HTU0_9PEZI|nr:hypothetical protein FGG08_007606 [Glutinoglossum americanum]
MLFAIFIRADPSTEAGQLPDTSLLTAMTAYNESLVSAGVLITGDGLAPSSRGARITFSGDPSTPPNITKGPFPVEELICGFWLLDIESIEEALEWVKKCPVGKGTVIEVRPGYKAEEFGEAFTDELKEKEEELRKKSKLGK